MGRARVIANLGLPTERYSARYLVEFDLGSEVKTAALNSLNELLNANIIAIGQVLSQIQVRQAEEDALRQALQAEELAVISAINAAGPESPLPPIDALNNARRALVQHLIGTTPLRLQLDALQAERLRLLREVGRWNQVVTIEQRPIWMLRFPSTPEGLTIGSTVDTIEINGEQGLSFIGGGNFGDQVFFPPPGRLTARGVMTPEQVFFNAAILPGWQRFKPVARLAVVDVATFNPTSSSPSRIDITLLPATSTPINIDINPTQTSLTHVGSNAPGDAYEPGDIVVVAFPQQTFANPQIVGWLDGPKRLPWLITSSSTYITQDDFGQTLPITNPSQIPPLSFSTSKRLTRRDPEFVVEFPSFAPFAVLTGPSRVRSANFTDNFDLNPQVGPLSLTGTYYAFPLSLGRPELRVQSGQFVAMDSNGLFSYKIETYVLDVTQGETLFPTFPRSYTARGITFLQEQSAGFQEGSGFPTLEAMVADRSTYDPELKIIAIFPNGTRVDLRCRQTGNTAAGSFEILSCNPDFIGPLS
jgi:hypothetical protein